ncbi:MAG: AraC family transcriptional regulator [Clostridiales Family XIII bacterium]|nr:AraC family transcriptional regulator [Clostridiales Family XIII bacterium]
MAEEAYTVLIVEDEPIEQEFIKTIISQNLCGGGGDILTSRDGYEAVALAKEHRPDLVLMDLWIAGLDGISAIGRIREILPNSCISILTGHMDFTCAQKAIRFNVFEYLVKPVRPSDLTQLVLRMKDAVKARGTAEGYERMEDARSPMIADAVLYIQDHYCEKLTLEEVAAKEFMSPAYFSRVFRKEMGVTFSRYVVDLKIRYACRLLKETRYPAYRIAAECGFSDPSYFNRVFAERMNMTPQGYRKELKDNPKD